ncbi:aphA, partial [Symbiodinium microadriaticum]
ETITYLAGHGSHHTVTLKDLTRETKYFYTCGEDSSMSEVYHFNTPRNADSEEPIRLAVFGDMGYLDSVTRRMGILGSVTMSNNWSATFSRELLEDMKDNDEIDMIWHVGDVGYADDAAFHTIKTAVTFEYEGAYNGYMNWIQNLTNTLPYHVSVGNHESECHDPACVLRFKELGKPLSNFTAFNSRWHMPSPESGGVLSMWYSWNYGAVHFTNIDTSTDYPNAPEGEKGDSGIFDAGHFATDGEYLEWVERDLKAAHDDPNIKWILAGGHRPFSFDDPDYAQLETLFEKYGVAMYFAGHSHSYSRFSAEDNKGIIHIT